MGFNHVAIATRDLEATHRFYTEAMGFELVKVVTAATSDRGGWSRHLFYDTGDGTLFAVWDLHDDAIGEFDPAISTGLGLPVHINHIAFDAVDVDELTARRERWLDHGIDCAQIDHGWCESIYAQDPNGIMVEFCTLTHEFTAADREQADAALTAVEPELEPSPDVKFFESGKASV